MQMILGEVGGITEQAYIKHLTSLTSEGPDQQKKNLKKDLVSPAASVSQLNHGPNQPVTVSRLLL